MLTAATVAALLPDSRNFRNNRKCSGCLKNNMREKFEAEITAKVVTGTFENVLFYNLSQIAAIAANT
jgi:hypothetical protein